MDPNDLRRRIKAAKADLQPMLLAWHKLANEAKDASGNPRAFTAEEMEAHTALAADIDNLTSQIEAHNRALQAALACDRADEETAEDLHLNNISELPHASDDYRQAFHNVMAGQFDRTAVQNLGAMVGDESRFFNLTGTSPSTGSVLIPTVLEKQILMEAAANSPLFSLSGSIQLSGRINSIPFIAGGGVLAPRAEGEAYVLNEPTLSGKPLTIHNFGGFFPVAMELLEDAPALESMFSTLFSQSFTDTIEEYGLKGAGGQVDFKTMAGADVTLTITGKVPTGILAESTTNVAELVTATANTIAVADIMKVPLQIHASAGNGAAWMVSKEFLEVAQLTVDSTGRPLWYPSLVAGQPATLLGSPLYRSDRLGGLANNAFPAIYGNFKSGHKIALRKGITVKKSEHFLFGNNMLAVAADIRFGALVVMKKYLARLKVKSA
jgi:HK97 family phage major capsid protein